MNDDSVDRNAVSLVLSADQRTLHDALARKHDGLAVMYLSGIAVLHSDNPDRLALAAHALRELMEKVPKYIEAPMSEDTGKGKGATSLKEKVRQLEFAWASAKRSTKMSQAPWSGPIDRFICRFFTKLEEFFVAVNAEHPKRKAEFRTALHRLDPTSVGLPSDIENDRIESWRMCHDYLQGVAHHNPGCAPEELSKWLDRFERLLLDLLIPKTLDTFAELESIIEEGERDA